MPNHHRFLLPLVASALLTACGTEQPPEEKLLRPVRHVEVQYSDTEQQRTFSGASRTDEVIKLSFRTSGVLSVFNIKLGQSVQKGQLLGQLDNVQARLNYENSISSKNSVESNLKTAKLNLDRIRALYEKGGSSLSDFEVAKDSYRSAQQSYNSAIRNVGIQKDQLSYGDMYAPKDGTISAVEVEANENISAGQTVAILNAGKGMDIELGLPESVINKVALNMKTSVTFTVLPGQSFEGVVTEVSPSIDGNTATYPIKVNIVQPSEAIKSGMAANVTFNFASSSPDNADRAIIIPAKAVGEDSQGRFVYVIKQQGEQAFVNKQPVTVGQLTEAGFEILTGLSVGQHVATAGLQTLLDGQEVLFAPGSAP